MKKGGASAAGDIKKSLDDELNEGETHLTKKMKEEKAEFVKKFQKHQIKSTDEDFNKALASTSSKQISVISVAKAKRDNEDDVEELEEKTKKKAKKEHKR